MREGETVFLRHLLLACGSSESRKLDEKLYEAQNQERCVRRSMWWVLQLILIALAGLGYTTALLQDIPERHFVFLIGLFTRIGFGSSIGLAGFFLFWLAYRRQLKRQRDECRIFILNILHSCWERSASVVFPLPAAQLIDYPPARTLKLKP